MIEKTQDCIRKLEEPLEDNGNIAFNNWHSFTDGKNSETTEIKNILFALVPTLINGSALQS
jgi:hypothetical protein